MIKLETVGVVLYRDKGKEKGLIIKDITMLHLGDLPQEYIGKAPYAYRLDDTIQICMEQTGVVDVFRKEHIYDKERIERLVDNLEICGTRLRNINLELDQEMEDWRGSKHNYIV